MKNLFKYISVLIAVVMILSACTTAATETAAPATEAPALLRALKLKCSPGGLAPVKQMAWPRW